MSLIKLLPFVQHKHWQIGKKGTELRPLDHRDTSKQKRLPSAMAINTRTLWANHEHTLGLPLPTNKSRKPIILYKASFPLDFLHASYPIAPVACKVPITITHKVP